MSNDTGLVKVKYSPQYCKLLLAYFSTETREQETKQVKKKLIDKNNQEHIEYESVAKELPTIQAFAKSICTTTNTLYEWCNEYPAFAQAYERCKDMQQHFFVNPMLKGYYNPNAAKIVAINLFDWKDSNRTDNRNPKSELDKVSDRELDDKLADRLGNVTSFNKAM